MIRFRKLGLFIVLVSAFVLMASTTVVNLSVQVYGTLPCAQMPALTGAVTTTVGTCATQQAYLTGALSSVVTMTTAGTFYDGPTVALTVGTWYLTSSVDLQTTSTTSAVSFTCKLWDGTTTAGAGYIVVGAVASAAARNSQMALTGVLVETGSVTGKISCTSNTASQLIEPAPGASSPGNYASTLVAIRIK